MNSIFASITTSIANAGTFVIGKTMGCVNNLLLRIPGVVDIVTPEFIELEAECSAQLIHMGELSGAVSHIIACADDDAGLNEEELLKAQALLAAAQISCTEYQARLDKLSVSGILLRRIRKAGFKKVCTKIFDMLALPKFVVVGCGVIVTVLGIAVALDRMFGLCQ